MADEIKPVSETPGQTAAEPDTNPPVVTSPAATPRAATHGPEIEPWLREILRCPNCGSTLSDGSGPGGPELHCTNAECRLAYRIDDGIPVLLVDESRSLAD